MHSFNSKMQAMPNDAHTYHFVMKFSPIVSTSEVELLPELVLFVIEMPSLCPWLSLNPLSDFKIRLFFRRPPNAAFFIVGEDRQLVV